MPTNFCIECAAEIPPGSPDGCCTRCLFACGLEESTDESLPTQVGAGATHRTIGDYELLDEIARGGMGIVYRARQLSLDRIVAVKFILAGAFAGREQMLRFRAEAEAAAKLQHPNIIAIHETGEHEGQPFFSMDYVDGGDLSTLVREGPVAAHRAAELVQKLAEAIHYAHDRGILHRDLKPSNVLLDDSGQPRITDFGLARRVNKDSFLTVTGQVLGSPNFMPPEQAGSKHKAGRYSDVYALGGVLFYLLTGRPPLLAETVAETLQLVLNSDPVSPRLLNPSVSVDLATICLKCLEKEPGRRYSTAHEVAAELDRFLKDEPIHARPSNRAEKAWRWCLRKPMIAGLATITLLLLVLFAVGGPIAAFRISHARREAERNLYFANIKLANEALAANNLVQARAILEAINASPDQRPFRGWEWYHLNERCHPEQSVLLGRHQGYVSDVAVSRDDRFAASISGDGVVMVWNLEAHRLERTWTAHGSPDKGRPTFSGLAVGVSPDGTTIATGGRDGRVRIWDAASTNLLWQLDDLGGECRSIAFSHDGSVLAALEVGGRASLWRMNKDGPTLLHKWNAAAELARHLAFSPDDSRLVVSGYAQPATVWEISGSQSPRALRTLAGTHWHAAFSNDRRHLLAVAAGGHELRRWELKSWTELPRWRVLSANIESLAVSADGAIAAIGCGNGSIMIADVDDLSHSTPLLGHVEKVTGVAFLSHGRTLISSSWDGSVRLWDIPSARRLKAFPHGHATLAVCFSPDSNRLASVALVGRHVEGERSPRIEHSVVLWGLDGSDLRQLSTRSVGGSAFNSYPAFSSDSRILAVDDWRGGIELFAVPSLGSVDRLEGSAFSPWFSPDGRSLLYATNQSLADRVLTGGPARDLGLGNLGPIWRIAISPDDQTAAICTMADGEREIQLWDLSRRKQVALLKGHEASVYGLAFSPDGRWLASGGVDITIRVWRVATGTLVQSLIGHSRQVYSVAYSPDGSRLASAGEDGVVRLWDTGSGREVALLNAHAAMNCVAFSPDGRLLAAAAYDGTVRIWHAPSPVPLAR